MCIIIFFYKKTKYVFSFFLSVILYILLHKTSLYTKNINPLYVIQISFPKVGHLSCELVYIIF